MSAKFECLKLQILRCAFGMGHKEVTMKGVLEKGKEAKLTVAAASYITCIRSGDDRGALRFPSSAVDLEGSAEAEVCEVFSDFVPREVGCRVRVASEQNS